MELATLWRALARHRWLVLATFGLCAVVTLVAALGPDDRYKATATLSVEPSDDVSSQTGPQVVNFLMPSLQAQIASVSLGETVRAALAPQVAAADWDIGSSVEPGTGILRVSATSHDPAVVAPVADEFARTLPKAQPANSRIRITLIDEARTPEAPYAPARATIALSGLFLGAILAVLAALATSYVGRRRDTAREVRSRLHLPVLAEIPPFTARALARGTGPAELFTSDDAVAVEAFLSLRTNIEIAMVQHDLTSVVVTSQGAGAGKSTVAANLAWALALAGHRVKLVEADLRHPALSTRIRTAGPAAGSYDGLNIVDTSLPSLQLVGADAIRRLVADTSARLSEGAHPADIVTAYLPMILDMITEPGGIVILDAPPLSGVAETKLILAMTTASLLVVDTTARDVINVVEESVEDVRSSGSELLGVVLNRTPLNRARRRDVEHYYLLPSSVYAGDPRRTRYQPPVAAPNVVPAEPASQAVRVVGGVPGAGEFAAQPHLEAERNGITSSWVDNPPTSYPPPASYP